jgi:hypothetical protein
MWRGACGRGERKKEDERALGSFSPTRISATDSHESGDHHLGGGFTLSPIELEALSRLSRDPPSIQIVGRHERQSAHEQADRSAAGVRATQA